MAQSLYNVFFSPTGTTRAVVDKVADAIAADLDISNIIVNLTQPTKRPVAVGGEAGNVLVFGFPVYGGRVPAVLADSIKKFDGEGVYAIPVAVYGNRDYDDALVEAVDLLTAHGFKVVAAGAFIGEHSMAPRVGEGRPDANDLAIAEQFGHDIAAKLTQENYERPQVKGNRPYMDAMAPRDDRPKTTDACTVCGICVKRCPMGIIDAEDPAKIGEGCLQCNACVKSCPVNAKYFDDEMSLKIKAMLEGNFMARREPELFL